MIIHYIIYILISKIKKREIKVNFIIFHEIKQEDLYIINKQIQMIYMWMYIISNYSLEKCSNHLVLYVYFTPFRKKNCLIIN